MGSIERKLKRQQQKNGYKNFGRAFANVKDDQTARLASGVGLQPGENKLGKKPPLSVYLERVKQLEQLRLNEQEKIKQEKVEEEKKVDREWKDD